MFYLRSVKLEPQLDHMSIFFVRKLGLIIALAVAASIVGICVLISCKKKRSNALADTDLDLSMSD
jgi:hypothetical protein